MVAFLGGENVVIESETCHLESLLTAVAGRGVRFRNMGWEGDTVYAQPREVKYPKISQQLDRFGATVVFVQFGSMEALSKPVLPEFVAAYEKFLDQLAQQTPRIVLVTPTPFEKTENSLLPDLSARNSDLSTYAAAIRELGKRRNLTVADVFTELGAGKSRERLTENGVRLTTRGQAIWAQAIARQLGLADIARRAGGVSPRGEWKQQDFEHLRQIIITKNRLWYDYWRPMNWAFLGGDRTEQPSSRDHRNPKVRWFPDEMNQFLPLIEAKEKEIEELANKLK